MKMKLNPWPLGLYTAFGLFFVGMAAFVVVAATHREHLVNENYYEQEIKFQSQIDGAARAQQSGVAIVFDSVKGTLVIALPTAQLAQNFSGSVELYRPSAPNLDQQIKLEPKADGTQLLDVSKLAAGSWVVRAKWNSGGENYFIEQKIAVARK